MTKLPFTVSDDVLRRTGLSVWPAAGEVVEWRREGSSSMLENVEGCLHFSAIDSDGVSIVAGRFAVTNGEIGVEDEADLDMFIETLHGATVRRQEND